MAKTDSRRATTLSISLSPELASEVSSRVESGLYTSASELFREALRMLLRSELSGAGECADPLSHKPSELPPSAVRFSAASRLMDMGLALREQKALVAGFDQSQAQERLAQLAESQEAGPGLRVAPDRLKKLKLDEPS